jgi:hypothetical protein
MYVRARVGSMALSGHVGSIVGARGSIPRGIESVVRARESNARERGDRSGAHLVRSVTSWLVRVIGPSPYVMYSV